MLGLLVMVATVAAYDCPTTHPSTRAETRRFHVPMVRLHIVAPRDAEVYVLDEEGCFAETSVRSSGGATMYVEPGRFTIVVSSRVSPSLLRLGQATIDVRHTTTVEPPLRKLALRTASLDVVDVEHHPLVGVRLVPRYEAGLSPEERWLLVGGWFADTSARGSTRLQLPVETAPIDVLDQEGNVRDTIEVAADTKTVELHVRADVSCQPPLAYDRWRIDECPGKRAHSKRLAGSWTSAKRGVETGIAFFWPSGVRWFDVALRSVRDESFVAHIELGEPCMLALKSGEPEPPKLCD